METYDIKTEERKRFLKYFRVWIIIAAIAAVAFGVVTFVKVRKHFHGRSQVKRPVKRRVGRRMMLHRMGIMMTDA